MILPKLKIGKHIAQLPIIQGGMAVRISTAKLAAAVANEGGIGIIAATGMSFDELRSEIREARSLTKGIIGINAMVAVSIFQDYLRIAMEEGIDMVLAGAGFSRDMFAMGREYGVAIVPIVSSAKLAIISEKLGADAVVVEGKEAGGHLGTAESVWKLVPEVRAAVSIPVIGAGGIVDGQDIVKMLQTGADGVQMGIRFAMSEECAADQRWKQVCLEAENEDIVLIDSPAGFPGRAVKTSFIERAMEGGAPPPETCINCLRHCTKSFCIFKALRNSQEGNIEEGVVFSGEYVGKIKDILPVKDIMARLVKEAEQA